MNRKDAYTRMAMNYKKFSNRDWIELIDLIKENRFGEWKREFEKRIRKNG